MRHRRVDRDQQVELRQRRRGLAEVEDATADIVHQSAGAEPLDVLLVDAPLQAEEQQLRIARKRQEMLERHRALTVLRLARHRRPIDADAQLRLLEPAEFDAALLGRPEIGRPGRNRREIGSAQMRQRHHRRMDVERRELLFLGHDLVDVVGRAQQFLQQRLAEDDDSGAAPLQFTGEAHEQQHVAQALLRIEQDALALQRPAVPRRLRKVGRRRLGQALADLVGGKTRFELAAHQERDRELDADAPAVGIDRQGAAEAADGFVEAAEVAQAEREIEEALGIVAAERDRPVVMLHRLVETIHGAQRIAEIGMQGRILRVGRQRQPVMRHRGFELARESQRDTEIVVQLGMIGANGEQPQVGSDRLVDAPGAVGLRRQAQLLDEAVGGAAEQRRRRAGSRGFTLRRMDVGRVVHACSLPQRPHTSIRPHMKMAPTQRPAPFDFWIVPATSC